MKMKKTNIIRTVKLMSVTAITAICALPAYAQMAPVPGYVAPLTITTTPDYADDTRGIFVPAHEQFRMRTHEEQQRAKNPFGAQFQLASADYTGPESLVADAYSDDQVMEQELNRISNGYAGYPEGMQQVQAQPAMPQMQVMQQQPVMRTQPMQQPSAPVQMATAPMQKTYTAPVTTSAGGVEIARGEIKRKVLDMQNGIVRLREDRISVRRALQRMMDQIGGGEWTIVWDMADQNAALPDTEISLYAEEPFMSVMNALLARIQTRSGQPLRVIRYDSTQRLIITDRSGGHRVGNGNAPSAVGVGDVDEVAVTETVLKEAMVSLHYDEVPLVDALENLVNQAGRGEWRLRVYAGLDQVLKPAHIEEPFNVALERILKLFNLKYEIFPGGKLVVVTHNNRFGYNGVQQ